MKCLSAAAIPVLVCGAGALADTVSITADRDNTLYQDTQGALSNGLGECVFVGKTTNGFIRRALMRFNIASAVPAGSTITGVTLSLNLSMTVSFDETLGLYRLLKDWGEGTSVAGLPGGIGGGGGATSTPNDATWLHRFYNTVFWSAPGATPDGADPDYVGTASATTIVGNPFQRYTWGPAAGMSSDVQAWLNDPSHNFGWIIIGGEEMTQTAKRFDGKDNMVQANRPILTITFTPGGVGCYPNCDHSTSVPFLNVNDFICFQAKFAAGDSYANCDGSTAPPVLNVNDFICFQSKFAAGCTAP
jgi:hypothetical protein